MAGQELGKEIIGAAAGEFGADCVTEPTNNEIVNNMAEGVVLAAAWFTVRMICQVSYKAVKSFRQGKQQAIAKPGAGGDPEAQGDPEAKAKGDPPDAKGYPVQTNRAFAPAYGGDSGKGGGGGGRNDCVQAVPAQAEANGDGGSCVPWGRVVHETPAVGKTGEPSSQASSRSLRDDDGAWVEELRRAINSRNRDGLRILGEIQQLGDKIDNLPLDALYDNLRHAMKLLLEYQQNPGYRTANDTLKEAEEVARLVYNNERSLVMSLSALRLRIVITYLQSQGLEPSMDDKEQDKRQCHIFITNALTQAPLETLCRKFLAGRDARDKQERERVELETVLAFDIILEVISSVYLLEPFRPKEGILPKGVPDIVLHALSAYCKSELGNSLIYTDLAEALKDWESSPQRKEKWALHCLYTSTDGPAWACSEGWDNLFETDLSSLYGVSAEAGRVTKISLGANNLDGRLPPQLENLEHLQELSLPGNELVGKVPAALWELPCLRVVALHGNRFTVVPPADKFRPAAACIGALGGGVFQEQERPRRRGVTGKVEPRNPGRLEVYKGEWFSCSWNITNTGSVAFAKGTKLSRGEEHSFLGGPVEVVVNPLAPGEEQIVTVMQQAPNFEAWALRDEWALVGDGLDFVDEEEAKAQTPDVTVVPRPAAGKKKGGEDDDSAQTLANTVFVAAAAANSRRRNSSQHSSASSSGPPYPYSRHSSGSSSTYKAYRAGSR